MVLSSDGERDSARRPRSLRARPPVGHVFRMEIRMEIVERTRLRHGNGPDPRAAQPGRERLRLRFLAMHEEYVLDGAVAGPRERDQLARVRVARERADVHDLRLDRDVDPE